MYLFVNVFSREKRIVKKIRVYFLKKIIGMFFDSVFII